MNIHKTIDLLRFYDYIGINEKYYSKISKAVGGYLESSPIIFDIEDVDLCKIIEHYPSLYYNKKYKVIGISDSFRKDLENNECKFISPWLHNKEYKSYNLVSYCSYGNLDMVKYFLEDIDPECFSAIDYFTYKRSVDIAARNGHLNVVKYLYKIFPNGAPKRGISGIYHDFIKESIQEDNIEIAKWVVESGFFNLMFITERLLYPILLERKVKLLESLYKNVKDFFKFSKIIICAPIPISFDIIKIIYNNGYGIKKLDEDYPSFKNQTVL